MPGKQWQALPFVRACFTLLPIAAALGCSAANGGAEFEEYDPSSGTSSPIRNPTGPATAYPEAALVDMGGGRCSGAVVAPRVVLTAGHCVTGASSWTVTTPYAKDANNQPQKRKATGSWTDYVSWGGQVNPNTPDVALVFFDNGEPFKLATWPRIQMTQLPNGTKAINVGRVSNNQLSNSNLYVGAAITLSQSGSFPHSYSSTEIIQSGDSGGPVFLTGGTPHTIVAVNSGAGGGQILARTDAVAAKITQLINQHGGPGVDTDPGGGGGTGGSGGGGGGGTGGSAGGGAGGGSGGGGGGCTVQEVEPNHPFSSAQQFNVGTLCGQFQQVGDEDWFKWSVPGAGVDYDVSVSGSDAQLLMWKLVNGKYYKLANQTPTAIANTSNGSGEYYMSIWSPTGSVGGYQLVLKRSDMDDPGGTGGAAGSGGSAGGGGSGGSGGSAGGGGSGGGTGGGGGGTCDPEQQPNDNTSQAQPLVTAICGTIDAGGDNDWSAWSVSDAGVHYVVSVAGQDAQVLMWKRVNGVYYKIDNLTPSSVENTSNGPSEYFIAVWSPSLASQSYTLTLQQDGGGTGGAAGAGGSGGSGGAAGGGGSGGSGGAAGGGGSGGAPPAADVEWLDFPEQKQASNASWGTLLTDIERHLPTQYGSQYMDSDKVTHAHETTHGINSHLRNYFNTTGQKANGFYVTGNVGVIIKEPGITKSAVGPYVPTSLREFRFSTYITGQTAWDDTPLYVFDEWVSYSNGTAVGVNRVKEGKWNEGWRDQLGNIEFVVYSLALGMAVRDKVPSYFNDYGQFRAFLRWHTERAMALYHEAQGMQEFAWDRCATYYDKMRTSSDAEPMRQFVRDTYGDAWAQSVMGF